jgi:Cysteine-rich secretory protein family
MGPGLIVPIVFMAQFLPPPAPSVLEAFNQLRANPAGFAVILRERRKYFVGKLLKIPGEPDLLTSEGVTPLDEVVEQLRTMRAALSPVVLSDGLSRAAADHVRDTGGIGITSHTGTDGSNFTKRIARYGMWSGGASEVIDYGARDAAEVILNLLIDDGVANRGHRKSLLDPRWRYAGIACGTHSVLRTMCVIDFAASYKPVKPPGR